MSVKWNSYISLPRTTLVAAVALSVLCGVAAPVGAAVPKEEPPTTYEAIGRTGVLRQTASDGPSELNGTSLADGVTLNPVGAGLIQEAADPEIPEDPETSIVTSGGEESQTGPTMSISMPASDASLKAPASSPGAQASRSASDSYESTGLLTSPTDLPQTEAAVQSLQDGVRMMTVIKGPQAPDRARYKLTLPDGARLLEATPSYTADQPMPEGELPMTSYVIVSAEDAVLGGIEAPWAVDATGKQVPTHSYKNLLV
jgi:hypothetical protein